MSLSFDFKGDIIIIDIKFGTENGLRFFKALCENKAPIFVNKS